MKDKVKKWFESELSMCIEESLDAIECEDIMHICVKAIEELEQYKAIGTVEDIQKLVSFLSDDNKRSILDDLELLNQYRALGTVEDIQTMKDNGAFSEIELAKIAARLQRLKDYEAIGTVEDFKALKEKNVAKKPIDKIMYLECPTCGDVGILDCGYCSACGQKLDWQ